MPKQTINYALTENGLCELIHGHTYTFFKTTGRDKSGNEVEVQLLVDIENRQHIILETSQDKTDVQSD